MNLFLQYNRCSTCRKAKKWLEENRISFEDRDIIQKNPKKEELETWHKKSNLPLKSFFNTSGVLYKELNLKDKLKEMSEEEQLQLLSSNGKLIKRPLLITDSYVLVGFKEEDWTNILK